MKNLLVAFAVLSLLACDTDVTQDYTIPYTEKLVLESFISPQDSLIEVRVMKTAPSIGKVDRTGPENRNLTDALVELSNGTRTVTLQFATYTFPHPYGGSQVVNGYFLKASEFPIEAGQTYTLRVSVSSGLSAQAQCTVPRRNLSLSEVDVQKGTVRENGLPRPTLQIRVHDAAGVVNRYSAVLFRSNEFRDNTGKVVGLNRYPTLTEYLTDTNRDGEWLSTPKANVYVNPGDLVELYVATTDAAYYDYNTTIEKQRDAQGNPFAEPQPVYSNVSGGLGVFAAYQWVKVPVVL